MFLFVCLCIYECYLTFVHTTFITIISKVSLTINNNCYVIVDLSHCYYFSYHYIFHVTIIIISVIVPITFNHHYYYCFIISSFIICVII